MDIKNKHQVCIIFCADLKLQQKPWQRFKCLMSNLLVGQNYLCGIHDSGWNFISRFMTGDEIWVYGYDMETEQQSSRWKSPGSLRPKKTSQSKSSIKSKSSFSVTSRKLCSKNLTLLTRHLSSTVMFCGTCMKMWGGDTLGHSKEKKLASLLLTVRQDVQYPAVSAKSYMTHP